VGEVVKVMGRQRVLVKVRGGRARAWSPGAHGFERRLRVDFGVPNPQTMRRSAPVLKNLAN
jgi:hypothetical protein